jgi:hypothetical protein
VPWAAAHPALYDSRPALVVRARAMLRRQAPAAVPRLVPRLCLLAALLGLLVSGSCATHGGRGGPPPPPPPPPGQALTPEPPVPEDEPLPVRAVEEPIVVAAWAEPRQLPPGGGQAQILVRIQKPGGRRFPGVEVRLRASPGQLYSNGRVLVTDAQGMTRDRLTTRKTSIVTLNAGGTRYRFRVPVADSP